MLLLILREEFVCLSILLFLCYYYHKAKIKEKHQTFDRLIICAIAYVFFDIITIITVNHLDTVPLWVNNLCHCTYYFLGVSLGFLFFIYAVKTCKIYKTEKYLKWVSSFGLISYTIIALFSDVEYIIGSPSNYSGGDLSFITYIFFFIYCMSGTILLVKHSKNIDDRVKHSILPAVFGIWSGIVVQIIRPELLITGGMATLLCLSVFIALDNPDKHYKRQALWDFLTGLKNSNSYQQDVERYNEHLTGRVGVLMADVNNLKKINDTCGHEEGDKFIVTAASILKADLKSADSVYRVGGDEFVAIFINPNSQFIKAEMKNVHRHCAKQEYQYPLEIAMGFCAGVGDIYDIIQKADKRMYENKQVLKNKQGES